MLADFEVPHTIQFGDRFDQRTVARMARHTLVRFYVRSTLTGTPTTATGTSTPLRWSIPTSGTMATRSSPATVMILPTTIGWKFCFEYHVATRLTSAPPHPIALPTTHSVLFPFASLPKRRAERIGAYPA